MTHGGQALIGPQTRCFLSGHSVTDAPQKANLQPGSVVPFLQASTQVAPAAHMTAAQSFGAAQWNVHALPAAHETAHVPEAQLKSQLLPCPQMQLPLAEHVPLQDALLPRQLTAQ